MQQAVQSASAQQVSQHPQPQQVGAELRMDCESISPDVCYCGACGDVYEEITDEVED